MTTREHYVWNMKDMLNVIEDDDYVSFKEINDKCVSIGFFFNENTLKERIRRILLTTFYARRVTLAPVPFSKYLADLASDDKEIFCRGVITMLKEVRDSAMQEHVKNSFIELINKKVEEGFPTITDFIARLSGPPSFDDFDLEF